MFEYAIKNLEAVIDHIYDLYGDTIYDNTETAKENKKKIKEIEMAIGVLQELDTDDIKRRLINSIMKELGLAEDNK